MTRTPFHHKYRPQTFAELVGQEAIAQTLSNALQQQQIAPAYLFTGTRGTGKTSSARIFAKSLNCLSSPIPTTDPCGTCQVCEAIARGTALDVIEIDAASNTGVDNIRELIERTQFAPVQCRYKVYVIDECHMLSTAAFNALLKTLEEPPERVVFVLATTDPQKVLPTIISRCQRFDFRRIPLEEIAAHLDDVAEEEGINIASEALHLIAQISQGGLRDSLVLLEQLSSVSFPAGGITTQEVWQIAGLPPEQDIANLLKNLFEADLIAVSTQVKQLIDGGQNPLSILLQTLKMIRSLTLLQAGSTHSTLMDCSKEAIATLRPIANPKLARKTAEIRNSLMGQSGQLKNSNNPALWLELMLHQCCDIE